MVRGFQRIEGDALPEPYKSLVAAAGAKRGQGSAVTQGNLGGEIGLFFVGGLLALGAVALIAMSPGSISWREPAAAIAGLALVAFGVVRLKKRGGSKVGTFTLETDAYRIEADAGVLRVWSWADAQALTVQHQFQNGAYQQSVLICSVPGELLVLGDRLQNPHSTTPAEAIAQSPVFAAASARIDAARARLADGSWAQLDGAELLP